MFSKRGTTVKSLSRSQIKNNYFLSRILNQGRRGEKRYSAALVSRKKNGRHYPADEILVNELLASPYRCSKESLSSPLCRFIASQPFFPNSFRGGNKGGDVVIYTATTPRVSWNPFYKLSDNRKTQIRVLPSARDTLKQLLIYTSH